MRVVFSVVLCVLVPSEFLLAQNITTPSPTWSTTFFTTPADDTCSELSPPVNTTISPNKTSAVLTWTTYQANVNCLPDILNVSCVAFREDNQDGWWWVQQNSTATSGINDTEVVVLVENLTEFTNYTCWGILGNGFGNVSNQTEIKFQTLQEVSTAPLNLTVVEKDNSSFVVQWQKPFKNPGLFVTYHVHIESIGPNHFLPSNCSAEVYDRWHTSTIEQYEVLEASPDYLYAATVFLENSAGNGSIATVNVTTDTSASEPPTNFVLQTPELKIEENIFLQNVSWNMPCETNGPIEYFTIELQGYYLQGHNVTHEDTFSVNASDIDEYFRVIQLNPATTYNIGIRANGINETGKLYNETFTTEENFPGPPILNDVTVNETNNLTISWTEPKRKAGTISSYNITIDPLGPGYDVDPSRCSTEEENWNEALRSDETSYNFVEGRSYYRYNVSVVASTSRGYGVPVTIEVQTPSSTPEMPADLTFKFDDENVTASTIWKTPCQANGPIKAFNVTVTGTYSEDEFPDIMNETGVVYTNQTFTYTYDISLRESYNYEVKVRAILDDGTAGHTDSLNFTTLDGFPEPPANVGFNEVTHNSFGVSWNRPVKRNGRILEYQVFIDPVEPLYVTNCATNNTHVEWINGSDTSFTFRRAEPYYSYNVSTFAKTSRGVGAASVPKNVRTLPSFPENVENIDFTNEYPTQEEYDGHVDIRFDPPCRANGPMLNYTLVLTRQNDSVTESITSVIPSFHGIPLQPDFIYKFSIKTNNGHFSNTSASTTFKSRSGVPTFRGNFQLEISTGTTSATITLRKEDFNNENGEIRYLAVLLSEVGRTEGNFSKWTDWPEDDDYASQLTKNYWQPFLDRDNVTFTIGNGSCDESFCNPVLESGRDYYVTVRVFTADFYKDSSSMHFRTATLSKLDVILGVIFGLLGFALLGVAGFIVWRRNFVKFPRILYARKTSVKTPTNGNTSIPIHKFVQYCKNLENNPEKFTEQYMLLTEKSKEILSTHTTTIAELTENRRKNRYTNILPYDATRVKLLIDEDDEIGSDYINASYIKGYSGDIEYIATQGPLPTTCRDFWKMVIQENVSIIVMVTQFVEENKEKCYRYFPNNHESMTIGDDMEVRCTMELHFGTYCVRTIQVKKDAAQVTVTHMQYLDWPDFNVPKGTDTMLQFCHQMRERLKLEGGYVIVHCSAGVGRTGTLIATDILTQGINAGKNIDIFNTVLELRKQRMTMVQAQKQYVYIHHLIKDTLESQATGITDNMEPIYENQSALQLKSDDDNLIDKEKEKESQF